MAQIALQDYLRKIDELLEENRLAEVVAHCRHILQRYPRHVETYRVMGKALLEQQKHGDAADMFYRVLSVDPEDFISHAGLAIIHKGAAEIPNAIWHMERAYEMDPYNSAIQRELRELYARRDGLEPDRIALTRGALARLYARGELFQQATVELRQVMAAEPDRIDLQTLLAETLWRDEQRVDAVEVCLKIVEQLPYAIKANAILAEVWLVTGRIDEARLPLKQLMALIVPDKSSLDPETVVGRAFTAAAFIELPKLVKLEELDYVPSVQEAGAGAEWVQEVGFATDEADTDWLRAMDTEGIILSDESPVGNEEEDVLDWLREVAVSDQEEVLDIGADTIPDPFAGQAAEEDVITDAAEELPPAELASDDWLSEIADSAEPDFWQPGSVNDSTEVGEPEEAPEDVAGLANWLEEASGDQPFPLAEDQELAIGEIAADEAFPDWLGDLSPEPEGAEEDDAFSDWLPETVTEDESAVAMGELPDWLAESVASEADEAEAPDEKADWLESGVRAATLVAGAALAAELADDDDQDADAEAEQLEEAVGAAVSEPGVEELPDWLSELAAEDAPEADAGELPDWLAEPADTDEPVGVEELPEWLAGSVPAESDEPPKSLADWLAAQTKEEAWSPGDQLDEADWTEEAAGSVALVAGAALAADLVDDSDEATDDEIGQEAEPAELVEGPTDIGDDVLPDWLIGGQRELEEQVMGTPEGSEKDQQDVPEVPEEDLDETMRWLEELAAAQEASPDEPPSLQDQDAIEPDEPVSEDISFAEEDIPDWLQTELDETLVSDDRIPDWLQEGEPADQQPEEPEADVAAPTIAAAEALAGDDIPDWLRAQMPDDLDLSAPAGSGSEAMDDFADSLGWLDQIAAGEGEAIDEPPTLSWESLEIEAAALDDAGPDDDMSWLDELAVHEDATDEELATSAEAGEILAEPETALEEELSGEPDFAAEMEAEPFDLIEAADDEAAPISVEEPDLDQIPEDPDEAMAWLERLAAQQGAPAEELPSLSEQPATADEVAVNLEEEVTVDWDGEQEPAEIEPVEALGEMALAAEIPEDPDEAMAWLEQLAAQQGAPAEELPSLSQAEPAEEVVGEPAALEEASEAAEMARAKSEADAELEQALAELADIEMPADDDEAMAWLIALAGIEQAQSQPQVIEEMPTPPTAHKIVEMPDETVDEAVEEVVVEIIPTASEDETAEDEDEAMAWLEQLAARQGAALDELTSVEEIAEEVETPKWVSREAEEAPPEAYLEPEAEAALGVAEELEEELAAEYVESEAPEFEEALEIKEEIGEALPKAGEEPFLDMDQELAEQGVEGSMPDWLSLESAGEATTDELDWLDTFEETDFDSWLEAEEQTRTSMPTPDVGADSFAPTAVEEILFEEPAVSEIADEIEEVEAEWKEAETEIETGSLTLPPISGPIDREKLGEARSALESGDIDQAVDHYAGLIEEDQGLPMVIADLETAAGHLGAEPKLQRLLGDAYMRNGQLQKALEMYRQALDHL